MSKHAIELAEEIRSSLKHLEDWHANGCKCGHPNRREALDVLVERVQGLLTAARGAVELLDQIGSLEPCPVEAALRAAIAKCEAGK